MPYSIVQTIVCVEYSISINPMGPGRCHTAQEGDALCFLEVNMVSCKRCKSLPQQQ